MMSRFFCFILCIAWCCACTEEPVLNVPVPSPKICVSSFISPDTCVVFLYKNEYILAENIYDPDVKISIDNASKIKLYENGVYFTDLFPCNNEYYSYYATNKKLIPQNTYQIEIAADGYPDVSASTFLPEEVPILSVDTVSYLLDGFQYILCTVNFHDPLDEENYYFFEVQAKSPGGRGTFAACTFYSDDPVVEEKVEFGSNQLLFSDKSINGKGYGLKVSVSANKFHWSDLNFVLHSVSKDFYLHFKSYVHYDKAKEDEFSEPVLIYSNINRGLGIFAGYSNSVISFYGDSISYD